MKVHIQSLTQQEEARKISESENPDPNSIESEVVISTYITEVISRWAGIPVNKLN